ncbi:hypothetical protein, partial [Saccharopolyspora elongata]|uniref:hypothetical protein n=1 Tax=Saccharopolyspora elongata TaxID=2530387 RepID=UPI001F3F6654
MATSIGSFSHFRLPSSRFGVSGSSVLFWRLPSSLLDFGLSGDVPSGLEDVLSGEVLDGDVSG